MEEIMTVSIYAKEGPLDGCYHSWHHNLPTTTPHYTNWAQSLPEHGILPLGHKVQQLPAAAESSLYT